MAEESPVRQSRAAQAQAGDFEGALKTLDRLPAANPFERRARDATTAPALKDIAVFYLDQHHDPDARKALQALLKLFPPQAADDDTLKNIVILQAKTGDREGAEANLSLFRGRFPKIGAMAVLAEEYAKAGDRSKSRATIEDALRSVHGMAVHGLWDKILSETEFADPGVEQERAEEFRRDLDYDRTSFRFNEGLTLIAKAQAKIGDVDGAIKTAGLLRVVDELYRGEPAADCLRSIAWVQVQKNDFDGALKTCEIIADDERPFGSSKRSLLESIAREQSKSGNAKRAFEWAVKQEKPQGKLFALHGMAEGIVQRQQSENERARARP